MDCCCHKTKERENAEIQELIHHLSRIEGQVRGVKAMVENDRYCVDIITQVSAISASLNSFNKKLLSNHIKTCVVEDIREGDDAVVDELCQLIQKLMK
ncbi:MAG: metal-sensing transcriptional repressor [Lachnospiraceae bacterium]|nr:metal-sensing transcriptional repressor [Lachnospiraceae bacterium]